MYVQGASSFSQGDITAALTVVAVFTAIAAVGARPVLLGLCRFCFFLCLFRLWGRLLFQLGTGFRSGFARGAVR